MAGNFMRKALRALQLKKYHGCGMETSLSDLKEHLWDSERVELFPDEKIAFLNIRFGELFHRCNDAEWQDFIDYLGANRIKIRANRWWEFWDR
jgi:hypothetical protein